MSRRFSNTSAADLVEFINKIVGDNGYENYDVLINERNVTIAVVNRESGEGAEIDAAEICYAAEVAT